MLQGYIPISSFKPEKSADRNVPASAALTEKPSCLRLHAYIMVMPRGSSQHDALIWLNTHTEPSKNPSKTLLVCS